MGPSCARRARSGTAWFRRSGVNLGRVGFLAKVERADLERTLDQVVAGEYSIEERFRISATVGAFGRQQRDARLPE